MSEERTQEELEQLVEAQARGEEVAEAQAPTEQEPAEGRRLDQRRSKSVGGIGQNQAMQQAG